MFPRNAVFIVVTLCALSAERLSFAQVPTVGAVTTSVLPTTLEFGRYLYLVQHGNRDLIARQFNQSIVNTQVDSAHIFPDPLLTVGAYTVDLSRVGAQNQYGASLTIPIEWPAKRGARERLAYANRAVVAASLHEGWRLLRSGASDAWIDVLTSRLELEQKRESWQSLERLVQVNEHRLRAGDVGEVAVLQSRVEARRYQGEVLTAEGELRITLLGLAVQLGIPAVEVPAEFQTQGTLSVAARVFNEEELLRNAVRDRPDLEAARLALNAAQAQLDLVRANRGIDVAVTVGWIYNAPGAQGSAFQAPEYHTLGLSLTVPIPISRVIRGDLNAATFAVAQAEAELDAAQLKVGVEVRQALARYHSAVARMGLFDEGLLTNARTILDRTLFSYQRGESSLLEVLNARRTLDAVQLEYIATLAEHTRALVNVERVAAMWDLQL